MSIVNSDNQIHRLLIDGLLSSVKRHPDKIAIIVDEQSYSYSELYNTTQKMSNVLIDKGIKKGDRIAIYMDNSWPCIVAIYASLLSGSVFVLVNPQTKADKLEFILNDSDAKALISANSLQKTFLPVINNNSLLEFVIASGYKSEKKIPGQCSIYDFDELINSISNNAIIVDTIIPNDLAALIYTSGSTGFPKGVMQTHHAMFFVSWSILEYLRLDEDERIILVLPLAFDYGLYQLLMTINLGATLIIERSFAFPIKIYQRIEETSATVFPAVPTMFAMMVSAYKREPFNFPSITKITNTAAALSAEYIPWLRMILPNALTHNAAQTALSIPPEIATTNPLLCNLLRSELRIFAVI